MTIADIQAEIRSICDADSTSLTDATLLRRVNNAYEEIVGKLIQLDGKWEFDDTNYTNFPVGTQNLVDNQQDYAFNNTFLNILRVQVKDSSADWHLLTPLDKRDIGIALEEFLPNKALPMYYDKDAKSVLLYPPPDSTKVTLANGLKVYFQRTADIFTAAQVTTGTKEPGFASPYHHLIVYRAAIPYLMNYKPARVALYEKKADELERDLLNFYARREKDERPIFWLGQTNFR